MCIRDRCEVGFRRAAGSMQFARREEPTDDRDDLAFLDRLVFDLSAELAEGCVENALAQLGFRQALNAQVLDADQIMPSDERGRGLVEKVAPLPRRLAMNAGHSQLRFCSARA